MFVLIVLVITLIVLCGACVYIAYDTHRLSEKCKRLDRECNLYKLALYTIQAIKKYSL